MAVFCFQVIVEEVIHQDLAVLKDRHACVNRLVQHQPGFVHVNSCHVGSKDSVPVVIGARHQLVDLVIFPSSDYLHIHAVLQILHCFAKHRVVHQLVEVCFKVTFCLLAKLCVHADVWLHPQLLIKLYHSVNPFQAYSLSEIELQVVIMEHVLFFVL